MENKITFSVGTKPLKCKACNADITGLCFANQNNTEYLCEKCFYKDSRDL